MQGDKGGELLKSFCLSIQNQVPHAPPHCPQCLLHRLHAPRFHSPVGGLEEERVHPWYAGGRLRPEAVFAAAVL